MRPVTLTLTGNGSTASYTTAVMMDWRVAPFTVGLALDTGGSSTAFSAQVCYESPDNYTTTTYGSNAKWFEHGTITAKTADTQGSQDWPVRAIRLYANGTGTDTATLTIIQAGPVS